MEGLNPQVKRKILSDNPGRFYRILKHHSLPKGHYSFWEPLNSSLDLVFARPATIRRPSGKARIIISRRTGKMKTKHDLLQLGFSIAGIWQLYQRRKSGVGAQLDCFQQDRVIYAFVLNDECKYIGICDDPGTTLADRMSRYEGKVGSGTNERICDLIQASLASGHRIEIMALKPDASLEFAKLKVDLVRGWKSR
jgi:hypothetical protein